MKYRAALPVPVLVAGLFLAPAAQAWILQPVAPTGSLAVEVEVETTRDETVRLIVGLAQIRVDLQLGLLALQQNRAGTNHFGHARTTVLPEIAPGLTGVGGQELAPLLLALERAAGEEAITEAYHAAEKAMLKTRVALAPSSGQVMEAVIEMTRTAAGGIDASGLTPPGAYQSAWTMLMVARGELDLLSRDQDRATAKLAVDTAMAFDEVILFMPDPQQAGPVAFDPKVILDLVAHLEAVGRPA